MSGLKEVTLEMEGARDLALIANNDSVWLVVPLRWWDFATFIWWFFMPWDKKAKVKLSLTESADLEIRRAAALAPTGRPAVT